MTRGLLLSGLMLLLLGCKAKQTPPSSSSAPSTTVDLLLDDLTHRDDVDAETSKTLAEYGDWPSRYKEIIHFLSQLPTVDTDPAWSRIPTDSTAPGVHAAAVASEGKAQSEIYCSTCHLRPDPAVLTKSAWAWWFKKKMMLFEGIGIFDGSHRPVKGLPAKPYPTFKVSRANFASIVYSYLAAAPTYAIPQKEKPRAGAAAPFRHHFSAPVSPGTGSAYSAVFVDEERRQVILGSMKQVEVISPEGGRLAKLAVPGTPTQVVRRGNALYVTLIGETMWATDKAEGSVLKYNVTDAHWAADLTAEVLFDHLFRPVKVNFGDLNGDSIEDAVIPEFGLNTGRAGWFSGKAKGKYTANKPLFTESGFLETAILDLDRDGHLDIVALQAQEKENIFLAFNNGKGRFKTVRVDQKDPSFGYNTLALSDMDGDGHIDIVTTNGDNFDLFGSPLKNYHGVRVLINDKTNKFREQYFYPLHGAVQALTVDFDLDGDMDILAISYWPARKSPEGIVYLENKGGSQFAPHSIAVPPGAWMAAAAGDWDGDGDSDLALAAMELFKDDRPGYILLENTTRQKPTVGDPGEQKPH